MQDPDSKKGGSLSIVWGGGEGHDPKGPSERRDFITAREQPSKRDSFQVQRLAGLLYSGRDSTITEKRREPLLKRKRQLKQNAP